jgi:hypothetical protein
MMQYPLRDCSCRLARSNGNIRAQGVKPVGSIRRVFFLPSVGGGKLLILPFKCLLRRHRRDRPRKSGGPPLFVPSLKVQGDDTHNDSGFSVI